MYNKRKFNKINDKKSLRKVGKNWITVSVALLAMIGAGGAVASHPAHAQANLTAQQTDSKQTTANTTKTASDKSNNQNSQASYESAIKNDNASISADNNSVSDAKHQLMRSQNQLAVDQDGLNSYKGNKALSSYNANMASGSNNDAIAMMSNMKVPYNLASMAFSGASMTSAQANEAIANDPKLNSSAKKSMFASLGAASADSSLDSSIASSAAKSANDSLAKSAAKVADQNIAAESSMDKAGMTVDQRVAAFHKDHIDASQADSVMSADTSHVNSKQRLEIRHTLNHIDIEDKINGIKNNHAANVNKINRDNQHKQDVVKYNNHIQNVNKYNAFQKAHNARVAKAQKMANKKDQDSDEAFEIAFWEAVAKDEANQQAQQASASATDPRITSLEAQGVNPSVASEVVSLEGNPANSGEPTIGFDDDTVPTSPSASSESSIATVKNVNRIKPNKTAYYYNKGMEVTNVGTKNSPAYLRVVKGIYLHKNFSFKGAYKQLHYGDVLPVVAKYNVTVRNHGRREHVERYEVRVGKRNYFVSAYKGFTENAYVSNRDFKSSKHMYVKLTKDAYLYKDKRARTLDYLDTYYAGRVMHVKRIVRVGHVNRLELENGHYITANKNYVSIVK